MDLQSVLLCPKTKASKMYYKTKLQMHNFTCFNLGNKDEYCYTPGRSMRAPSAARFLPICSASTLSQS
ncbi:hypothetical protein CesoFtcFv8_002480 [Champsocephalus esox]|uniref:Uncharacterized protein n=1 Tax=Champsocephalus esox TaxID=159716 RepID=A0AAN8CY05_9TELE|nr:hypothetical protein CesoFtcFv8_002480 [Champsocephalus esox]